MGTFRPHAGQFSPGWGFFEVFFMDPNCNADCYIVQQQKAPDWPGLLLVAGGRFELPTYCL